MVHTDSSTPETRGGEPTGAAIVQGLTLAESAAELEAAFRSTWGQPTKRQPMSNNASKCCHPCAFYLWAVRARWEEIPPPDAGLMGIFRQGDDTARSIKEDLLAAGWRWSMDELTFHDRDLDLRGRVDGHIARTGHPVFGRPIPAELKSCSPNLFEHAASIRSLLAAPFSTMRLWPGQALAYAYLSPEDTPLFCLIIRNKSNRATRVLLERVDDWYHLLEQMNAVLARVNAALRTGTPPEAMAYDPVWCDRCEATALCPTMMSRVGRGQVVMLEPRDAEPLDALADAWRMRRPEVREHDRAYAGIKAQLRHHGRYEGKPGDVLTALTLRWRFTVKFTATQARLDLVPLGELEEEGGEEPRGASHSAQDEL